MFAVVLALGACSGTEPQPIQHTVAGATDLELEYRTWGLMPPPKCGTPVYEIRVARDRTVTCGWRSGCPPYSAAAPLRPKSKGSITIDQANHLADLVGADAFRALPKFDANAHIIDGGEEQLTVNLNGRAQTVELANIHHPEFDAVRSALERATGCAMATAGPMPP